MSWIEIALFVVFVCAIAVAWWEIAVRIVRERTREGLSRIDMTPSDDQLLGLVLHNQDDGRVRRATSELDTDELRESIDKIRADETTDQAADQAAGETPGEPEGVQAEESG